MKKSICIVEDDAGIRDIIGYILEDDSYNVQLCSSAKEFNAIISVSVPDVVVFDIMLPDGNGIELCKEMKDRGNTSSVPVLLMSAHSRPDEAMESGCADAFISKPFDIDYFKDKVTSYLAG
ncbi:response regulator transcription factor [Sphingobacterium pedocola]|jgi:two-component system phosphate regulon response regulator PhoB|uniref:Response regulator n=1 Tax=Sphingobacterium pedocola TaxID=2082722 RepID=A0ABR9TDQ6_9SPHI|nr:response regulator [Sphingobacterium pedocola]MBE8722994.1 response regulator [Sphingobacterium pedocola]